MGVLLAAGAAAGITPAFGQGFRARRNIFSLSPQDDDLAALRDGIAAMQRLPAFNPYSIEAARSLHAEYGRHNSWLFFPWHRVELAYFESVIAGITGHTGFALPYWDYQYNGHLPDEFYDPASPLSHAGRVGWDVDFAQSRWNMGPPADLVGDPFEAFVGTPWGAGQAEAYGHNLIHSIAGGDMSYLSSAPLDPLFFVHHCNIDRVWASWQAIHANEALPDEWLNEPLIFPAGTINGLAVGNTLATGNFGYGYDELYPYRFFSVTDTPPPGMKVTAKRETVSEETIELQADASSGALRVELPADFLARYRADRDQLLVLDGTGWVTFAMDGLDGRVVTVTARAEGKQPALRLSASIPILHAKPGAEHDHAMAGGTKQPMATDYAHCFRFGANISNIIGRSEGPVALTAEAPALDGVSPAAPARPIALRCTLKVKTTRWIDA